MWEKWEIYTLLDPLERPNLGSHCFLEIDIYVKSLYKNLAGRKQSACVPCHTVGRKVYADMQELPTDEHKVPS
jgi:hypothetical protein